MLSSGGATSGVRAAMVPIVVPGPGSQAGLLTGVLQVTWADGHEGYGKHYFEYNH